MSAHTAEDVSDWLLKLRMKILEICKANEPFGLDDIRYETFHTFNALAEHYIILHNMFSAFEKGIVPDDVSKKLFRFSITDKNYADTIENMGKFEKVSFTVLVNFNVEVFCKVTLQSLRGRNPSDRFRDIIDNLVTELGLSDANNKKRNLYTMASIRNALHSNGVHTKDDVPRYTLDGKTFEFLRGRPVECASWPHLCAAFEAIVDILDEIVKTPRVRGIPGVLPWQYVPI